jgi:hypothetical protein
MMIKSVYSTYCLTFYESFPQSANNKFVNPCSEAVTFLFVHLSRHTYKVKAIPVKGREGPWVVRRRGSQFSLDNRLTDGGKVVSLLRQPPFTPRKIPGTHFC